MTVQPLVQPQVRPVSDARPPGLTWARAAPPHVPTRPARHEQPPLVFDPGAEPVGRPRPSGHRVLVVAPEESPAPGLPDARSWSAALALALAEALIGRRPIGQLSRWVDERVLATITVAVRQQRHPGRRSVTSAPPARLRSVHLQYPVPDAVEVSAHIQLAAHSSAIAFRLAVWYDRWLCTELELGPRHQAL